MKSDNKSFSLAWDTFDFHMCNLSDLEAENIENLRQYKNIKKTLNPSQRYKIYLKKKLIKHFDKLINEYSKFIFAITDVTNHHRYRMSNGISIPSEREIKIHYLDEIKNVTATQLEQVKDWKTEVLEVLG